MSASLSTTHPGVFSATSFSGNGSSITGLTRGNISAGTPNQVLVNDGAGLISSVATLNTARGGTGADSSAASGVAKVAAGTWTWSQVTDSDISPTAAIARSKIAAGTAGQVVINGVSGGLSSEAQLSVTRGGTGINSSLLTGVVKVNTGTWSASTIVDVDISATANITRSKLATGLANHVLTNNASGVVSSEAQLAVSRGGTGQDFSASGAGPFVPQVSSGLFSLVAATPSATINTYVTRNGSGASSFGIVNTPTVTATGAMTVNPTGNLTLDPGGVLSTTDTVIESVPSGIAGGKVTRYTINLSVTGAVYVPFWTLLTTDDTAYTVSVVMAGMDSAIAATVSFSFTYRARNLAGAVSKFSDQAIISSQDPLLAAAGARGYSTVNSIGVQVSAATGRTVRWCGHITVVSQS